MKTVHDILKELRACKEGVKWAKKYNTIEEIVANIHRGEWLLWLGATLGLPVKDITLAKARCAKTVVHLMKDERSKKAVDVAEKFGLGKATRAELNSAYYNACETDASNYSAADDAAICASDLNTSYAYETACDTYYAVYSYAIASASLPFAAPGAANKNRKVTADICREVLAELIIKKVNELLTIKY